MSWSARTDISREEELKWRGRLCISTKHSNMTYTHFFPIMSARAMQENNNKKIMWFFKFHLLTYKISQLKENFLGLAQLFQILVIQGIRLLFFWDFSWAKRQKWILVCILSRISCLLLIFKISKSQKRGNCATMLHFRILK